MKSKWFKRVMALTLMAAMVLTACGQEKVSNTSESEKVSSESEAVSETASESEATETEKKPINKKDLPVISYYPENALTFSGLQEGYRSDIFAELGGFQIEYWSYSVDKTNAMMVSGDLPDMMVLREGTDNFKTLVDKGQLINYDDYQEYLPNIFENPTNEYWPENLQFSRENLSNGTGDLYILPGGLGYTMAQWRNANAFSSNVPKVKWDVYQAIGAPEIKDLWDLIDVMEEMVAYKPTAEDGSKIYGTNLVGDRDNKYFYSLTIWYNWDGYDIKLNEYFVEGQHSTGEVKSILTKDSKYYEGLKWLNEVNRRGLLDPDSVSATLTDQNAKVTNGLVMVPCGVSGAPTNYYEVFIPELTTYVAPANTKLGSGSAGIVINKDTEYLEECLAFVNMIADPYVMMQLMYGPEGDTWQKDGNVVSITDRFADWLKEKGAINGFPLSDGTEWNAWYGGNLVAAPNRLNGYVGLNGEEVSITPYLWQDALAITEDSDNWRSWKEHNDADGLWEYAEKNNIELCTKSAFSGLVLPTPSDEQTIQIASIKEAIVPASWQCVYAESEAEFEQIWDQMVKDAMALGAQEIIDWRIQCYKDAMAAK